MAIDDINARYGRYLDAMTEAFAEHLSDVVKRAQIAIIVRLQKDLKITNGILDSVPGNLRLLRQLDDIFAQAMNDAGYQHLVDAFVAQFPGQLRFMQEIISDLNDSIKRKLIPTQLTATTRDILNSFQVNAAQALETLVTRAGQLAMNKTLFSVGGLKFGKLVETISNTFSRSLAESTGLAETSMSVFMRVAMNGQFDAVQKGQDEPLRYEYSGPRDLLNREFCREMLEETAAGKSWTRDELENMDNDQDLSVWTACGGWRCRHQLILDVQALSEIGEQAA